MFFAGHEILPLFQTIHYSTPESGTPAGALLSRSEYRDLDAECCEPTRSRVHLSSGEPHGFSPELFRDDAEGILHHEVLQRVPDLAGAAAERRHREVYQRLSELGPVIDRYFDEVLVNAPDATIRDNRVKFLREIHYLFARFADLEEIAPA